MTTNTNTSTYWQASLVSDGAVTGGEMEGWMSGAAEIVVVAVTDHSVTVRIGPAPDEAHAESWLMDGLPDDGTADDIVVEDWAICDA